MTANSFEEIKAGEISKDMFIYLPDRLLFVFVDYLQKSEGKIRIIFEDKDAKKTKELTFKNDKILQVIRI